MIDHAAGEHLVALLDGVDVGLVWIDPAIDTAEINHTAAELLHLPAGTITTAQFAETMTGLAARCLNSAQAERELSELAGDAGAQLKTTWQFRDEPTHLGVVCKPAPYPLDGGRIWAFYDNSQLADAINASEQAAALLRVSTDAMLDPQVLVEGVWRDGRVVDLIYRNVNLATCKYLGMSREELVGHSLLHSLPNIDGSGLLAHYIRCAETGEPVILDDFPYYNEVLDDQRYYDIRGAQVRPGWMTLTWRDVTERSELAQRISLSEKRFRLLAENVADVVFRMIDGRVTWVSNSVEKAIGAPAEFFIGRQAIDFVVPDYRAAHEFAVAEVESGNSFIGRHKIFDINGNEHWIHFHSKPFVEADGTQNGIVTSFRVIDDEVAAELQAQEQIAQRDAQNRSLTHRLQEKTDRLVAELKSAARYVESILPGDLDGPVRVSSRYVPSRHLGGDSYDYRWIDDGHMVFYLLDVSGHGVESAMLSVSVHNLLRSGTFSHQKLLQPAAVLTELNRLFQMDQHGGNYFTIWYGVYQASTRRLRFACGGHPPALALLAQPGGEVTTTALNAPGLPIGLFEDTQFATGNYVVPPNTTLVLYSDGAFELDPDAGRWDPREFTELCTRMAGSADWSIDDVIAELADETTSGVFDDDCTLVRLIFD